jgi:(p)ppGpp synthase/HD superfamily hydrolase
MKLIEKSLLIALRAYAGKTDKAGREYILHPLRVMAKMETEMEMSAALLHDVIEDSEITAQNLLDEGIPAEVVEAVRCLTKNEGEEYMAFVARAKRNKLAAKVNIEDNIDVLRLASLNEYDLARIQKYHAAWHLLNEEP